MRIFITGIAGFIGFHVAKRLLELGHTVTGCDAFIDYYDVSLKRARIQELGIEIMECSIHDINVTDVKQCDRVLHLAAQAGVRYSLSHPKTYVDTNIVGTFHILELCRQAQLPLTFASSSSVYGLSERLPFAEDDRADSPANIYAASKRSTELMASSYHHLYGFPINALRYFTVYGPYGRPDMACYAFAQKMTRGEPITLFNEGNMERDFTYIDDIVEGTIAACQYEDGYQVFNLGNDTPVSVKTLVHELEKGLDMEAKIELGPMQEGEIVKTWASIEKARALLGFNPKTSIESGVASFCKWFTAYEGHQG